MKLLVEVSQGIGNCVQGTPLCHALWLLGHDVDLFVNQPQKAVKLTAEMWRNWPVVGRVWTHRSQFKVRDYDFAVVAYGRKLMQLLFPPGLSLCLRPSAVLNQSESDANVGLARALGYTGDTPTCFAGASGRDFKLPAGAITVHAGCAWFAPEKRWPHWKQVCESLRAEGRHVVIVGTQSDRSPERWEDAYANYFDLSLIDLNALLRQASAHFGNDSGVGHLAAAAGLPGVIVFGPTSPVKNHPNSRVITALAAPAHEGEEHDLVATKPVPIGRLPFEEVWAAIARVLKDPRRDPPRNLPERAQDSAAAREQVLRAIKVEEEADSRYLKLEGDYARLCATNALSIGNGVARDEMIRRAGAMQLELFEAKLAEGGKKARHKARAHARDAMRGGYLFRGLLSYLRAL
ncbi:MAG: hypothetical protein IT462_09290 [Planctomycetes bacterium]|nr:hypothetical protein [Planctomycetota bacterium]